MTAFSPAELHALLRADFYSFLVRCVRRASCRAELFAGLARRGSGGEASGRGRGPGEAAHRQRAAAASEVARRFGRPAGVAARPRSDAQRRQRHLRPGPVGKIRPRLPGDHDIALGTSALFPTRLASPREPLAELATTSGGSRLATSVGGVLTGRGADVIVIDDPLKPIDAMSESRRGAANDWFDSTLYSRLNDKAKGASSSSCSACTRTISPATCSGRAAGTSCRFRRSPRATSIRRSRRRSGRESFGGRRARRSHPEREPLATLSRIRATIGEMNFAAPIPAGACARRRGMIKAAWFRRYGLNEIPSPGDRGSTGSSRAGTPPTSRASLPTIPSAPPGASRARTSISSTCCAKNSPFPSSSAP